MREVNPTSKKEANGLQNDKLSGLQNTRPAVAVVAAVVGEQSLWTEKR